MNANKKTAARPTASKKPTSQAKNASSSASKRPVAPARKTESHKPPQAKKPTEAVRNRVQPTSRPAERAPQTINAAKKAPEARVASKRAAEAPSPVRKAPEAQAIPGKAPALNPAPQRASAPAAIAEAQVVKKPTTQRHGFKTTEFIVYPAHGVGQIVAIEEQEVAGYKLELFVINFVKDKMTLRVPITKVVSVGMRKLAEASVVKRALETLKGRARIKRTMWSRRAQEYEAKINSGDIVAIAEVVRDLHRSESQPEQSYSERQLYEAALDRLAREISVVQRLTETEAIKEIEGALAKGPRRGPKPDEAEEVLEEEAA